MFNLEEQEQHRLTITIGNGYECTITVQNSEGTAQDLSTASKMIFCIKDAYDDADSAALLSKTIDLTDSDHTLASGIIALKLLYTETANLTPGRYKWDIRVWKSSGPSPRNFPQGTAEVVILPRVRYGS